jgi:hypothetical protein
MVWGGRLCHFIEHIICDNLLLVTTIHQGFLGAFCDVAKSRDHPENNLAKFGYLPDMKVRKDRIFPYSWLPT